MSADPLIGKKLGDYTIQSLLGRGGMSRVYRGYDENLDRLAAVKVISTDLATTSEEEYTRRFQTEARSIARLRHPNIVGVYQFGRSEGIYYMAMVFLEGHDLRGLMNGYAERRTYMPISDMLRITRDVANALDYAHEQGVIHRDVKPSNIMLEKHTGRAILMDFGLALSIHEGTTGDTFGSAHYIAPEQAISSAKAVPQSDLYSLGIVLYEMLAGKVPFDDPSAMSVALQHVNDAPPPMTLYNPDLPPEVESVIMRALDKRPEHRYATGRELIDTLEGAFTYSNYYTEPVQVNSVPPFIPDQDSDPTPWFGRRPNRSPDPAETNPVPDGVMGRFARYKAQREDVTAVELPDEQLAIDENTLESILENYADPRDIGLVGPDAVPYRHSSQPSDLDDLRASLKSAPARRRGWRIGMLLISILLLAAALVAVWFTVGPGKPGDDNDSQVISGLLPTEESTLATEESTPAAAIPVSTAEATEVDLIMSMTDAIPSPGVTRTASPVPRETAGVPTATPAPTQMSTSIPVAVAGTTTVPVPPTLTPTTPSPSTETPTASAVASPVTNDPASTTTPAPDLRLIYDQDSLLLVNVADTPQDISPLVFRQEQPDGYVRSFEAGLWRVSNASLVAMPPQTCYEVVRAEVPLVAPDSALCGQLLGWYQPGMFSRYFWIEAAPDATFTVGNRTTGETLATCGIAAGECLVSLPD